MTETLSGARVESMLEPLWSAPAEPPVPDAIVLAGWHSDEPLSRLDLEDGIPEPLQRVLIEVTDSPASLVVKCRLDPEGAVRCRYLRKAAWTDLPTIGSGPLSVLSRGTHLQSRYDYRKDLRQIGRLTVRAFQGTKAVVIQAPMIDDHADELAAILRVVGRTEVPEILVAEGHPDSLSIRRAPAVLEAATKRLEARVPLDRFIWSYRVNFQMLAERAFMTTLRIGDTGRMGPSIPAEDWHSLSKPMAIQVLFSLRRAGEGDGTCKDGLFWQRDGGRLWAGSGRHPALVVASRGNTTFSGAFHDSGPEEMWSGFKPLMLVLIKGDFVSLEDAGWRLTTRGLAFLDLMPPELDDPDVLLRWTGPYGLPLPEHIPAMDRWLAKALRALKRRVNAIPPDGCDTPAAGCADPGWGVARVSTGR